MSVTMDTPGLLEHIEAKLEAPRPDCLIWPGAVDRGYGRVFVDGTAKRVHRVVWELKNGAIPEGLTVDHLCRIRSCCNTEHMELVTQTENVMRALPFRPAAPSTPRRSRGPVTECKNGHTYTPETTVIREDGRRRCMVCRTAQRKRDLAKRRARRAEALPLADAG